MHPPRRSILHPRSRRASVLLTALVLSAIIAISLGSFLRLASQSSELAYRGFYAGASMNAAETGLEQAMWTVNKRLAGDTTIWTTHGWTVLSSGAARRTFDLGTLSGGARAEVKVLVSNAQLAGANPYIVARSIITPLRGPPIERWIQITLSKRSRFSTGLVAKDLITFSGNNARVDSYDSRLGAYTPASLANRFDRGSAGSASVRADTFNLGNADIWGFAVVGTRDQSGLDVGPNGTVGPFGTAQGSIVSNHVMTGFTANFDDEPHPAAFTGPGAYTLASINGATTLPRAGDTPAADGRYYYNVGSISLGGNSGVLTVARDIVIRMSNNLSVTGQGRIVINAPAAGTTPKLEIYTRSDVDIGGNGVVNPSAPSTFTLWGTRPQTESSPQSISIRGNGVLSAVVYAPNANASFNGGGTNGDVFGSMIAKNITVTGGSAFHYDEALAQLDAGAPLGLQQWNEFTTPAEREAHRADLSF